MNRPFSAFTSLMALLALAMFAVSSTTRSTTVQPPRIAQRAAVRYQQPVANVSSHKPDINSLQLRTSLAGECSTPNPDSSQLKCLSLGSAEPKSSIQSVCIEIADQVAVSMRLESTRDDYLRDDSLCDWSVHDVRNAAAVGNVGLDQASAESVNLSDELSAIFNDLVSRRSAPLPQAGASNLPGKAIRWKALLAAAEAWFNYYWQTPAPIELQSSVGWDDYSEFAADLPKQSTTTPVRYWISDDGVRSGGLLRHSAAASRYPLTATLEGTGEELHAGALIAADSLSD